MRLYRDSYSEGDGAPLVIAHGLFGAARNWSSLAKRLARDRPVVAVDMRNHGDSGWDDDGSYAAMAADLGETIADLGGRADLLGHSMGGKAAMALALTEPDSVSRLIVADIAPVGYDHSQQPYLEAMRGVDLDRVSRRSDADPMLADAVPEAPLRAFLLQNLAIEDGRARWRLNLEALAANMDAMTGFPEFEATFEGPALFLRGGASDYAAGEAEPAIRARFPAARIETVEGAGHWLHAEKPEPFLAAVERFLAKA